jgi:DNA-binding transcriptional MocR family regulator
LPGLPPRIDTLALYGRALAAKISIAPRPFFSAKRKFQNCIRLNFGNPRSDAIEHALLKLGQLIAAMG